MFHDRFSHRILAFSLLGAALAIHFVAPVSSEHCPGPGGGSDPACECQLEWEPGWVPEFPPECLESTSIYLLSANHGCCGISGCQDPKPCTWRIYMEAHANPGQSCSFSFTINGSQVASCGGCSQLRYSPAQDEQVSCADSKTYRIYANGHLVSNEIFACVMCSG